MYSSLVFCLLVAFAAAVNYVPNSYVVIKNPASKLVVAQDGEKSIVVQTYSKGNEHQLWKFEQNLKGKYYIINKASGKAIEKAADSIYAQAAPLDECKDQQWDVNSNNTITNVDSLLFFDIKGAAYTHGTPLVIFEFRGSPNQQFVVESP